MGKQPFGKTKGGQAYPKKHNNKKVTGLHAPRYRYGENRRNDPKLFVGKNNQIDLDLINAQEFFLDHGLNPDLAFNRDGTIKSGRELNRILVKHQTHNEEKLSNVRKNSKYGSKTWYTEKWKVGDRSVAQFGMLLNYARPWIEDKESNHKRISLREASAKIGEIQKARGISPDPRYRARQQLEKAMEGNKINLPDGEVGNIGILPMTAEHKDPVDVMSKKNRTDKVQLVDTSAEIGGSRLLIDPANGQKYLEGSYYDQQLKKKRQNLGK